MELLTSAIPQDLRAHLEGRIQAHDAKGDKAILIVPEQFTLESEIALLGCLGKEATIDMLVMSFSGLARTLLSRLGLPSQIDLKDASQAMLVEKILLDLDISQASGGDREKLLETLVELRMEGLGPDDLRQAHDELSHKPLVQDKLCRVAEVLAAYEDALSHGLADKESQMERLVAAIPEAQWLEETHILLSDFQDLSHLELAVLKALDAKAASLTTYVLGRAQAGQDPVFYSSQAFIRRLQSQIPCQTTALPVQADIPSDLAQLAATALSYQGIVPQDAPSHISLVRAMSVEQEVTYLAAIIRQQVMAGDLRYRDISLTVTNPAVYLPVIDRVFRLNDIPVFIDARRDVIDHPLARALLYVLRIMEESFPLDAVMGFLQSGLLPVSPEDVMAYESQARSHKIRWQGLMDPQSFVVEEGARRSSEKVRQKEEERAQAGGRVAAFLQEIFADYYRQGRKKAPVQDHVSRLYAFLDQAPLRQGLDAFHQACLAQPEDGLAEENPQVLERVVHLLDEMVALLGEEALTFTHFADLLRAGLESLTVGIIPPAQDQVQVGALVRLRSEPKPWRMMLGLSDLWMPSQAGDRTVFSDQEKDLLAGSGIVFSSRQDRLSNQEALSFYATVLQAQDRLVLSYPLSEANAGAMHPAPLIGRSLELFPDLEETLVSDALDDVILALPAAARTHAMAILRAGLPEEGEVSPSQAQALAIFRHYQSQTGPTGRFLAEGLYYRKQAQALAPSLAQDLYRVQGGGRVSASQIETIRSCPYRHYVRYGLRPEEDRSFEIEERDFGNILHGALDRLTRDIQADPDLIGLSEDAVDARMEGYVQEAAAEALTPKRQADPQNKAYLNNIRRDARKAGRIILSQLQDVDFRPIAQEVDFGQAKPLPPLILQWPHGPIRLEGRIDRLDGSWQDDQLHLAVVDYKTGSREFDVTRAMDGLDAQLPLYLKASLGGDAEAKAAGLFYLSLKESFIQNESKEEAEIKKAFRKNLWLSGLVLDDPQVTTAFGMNQQKTGKGVVQVRQGKGNLLSQTLFAQFLAHVQKLAEEAIADAFAGDISLRPARIGETRQCDTCDYHALCQIEAGDPYGRDVPTVSWKELASLLEEEDQT